jgi:hypothetical protein
MLDRDHPLSEDAFQRQNTPARKLLGAAVALGFMGCLVGYAWFASALWMVLPVVTVGLAWWVSRD